jgi:ureidoglycolate hydrolase
MTQPIALKKLTAKLITPENFQPYGQLITPSEDGKLYDRSDAQLNLANGTPRFYIMRLTERGRKFHKIMRHLLCTQCLGSLEGKEWFIAVAPPSPSDRPDLDKMAAFRIPGNCFIKLEMGTWHAGPYFEHDAIDFYNLELSDTNEIDHFTHDFRARDRLEFELTSSPP